MQLRSAAVGRQARWAGLTITRGVSRRGDPASHSIARWDASPRQRALLMQRQAKAFRHLVDGIDRPDLAAGAAVSGQAPRARTTCPLAIALGIELVAAAGAKPGAWRDRRSALRAEGGLPRRGRSRLDGCTCPLARCRSPCPARGRPLLLRRPWRQFDIHEEVVDGPLVHEPLPPDEARQQSAASFGLDHACSRLPPAEPPALSRLQRASGGIGCKAIVLDVCPCRLAAGCRRKPRRCPALPLVLCGAGVASRHRLHHGRCRARRGQIPATGKRAHRRLQCRDRRALLRVVLRGRVASHCRLQLGGGGTRRGELPAASQGARRRLNFDRCPARRRQLLSIPDCPRCRLNARRRLSRRGKLLPSVQRACRSLHDSRRLTRRGELFAATRRAGGRCDECRSLAKLAKLPSWLKPARGGGNDGRRLAGGGKFPAAMQSTRCRPNHVCSFARRPELLSALQRSCRSLDRGRRLSGRGQLPPGLTRPPGGRDGRRRITRGLQLLAALGSPRGRCNARRRCCLANGELPAAPQGASGRRDLVGCTARFGQSHASPGTTPARLQLCCTHLRPDEGLPVQTRARSPLQRHRCRVLPLRVAFNARTGGPLQRRRCRMLSLLGTAGPISMRRLDDDCRRLALPLVSGDEDPAALVSQLAARFHGRHLSCSGRRRGL